MVTETEARELLTAHRHENVVPMRDDALLADIGIDLLDLVSLVYDSELDRDFGDEVPVALLASLRTVRDFLDLFTRWERDTAIDVAPQTVRSA